MLIVGELGATISGDTKGFDSALERVRKEGIRAAGEIRKNFRRVGSTLKDIGRQMTVGVTLPIVGAGFAAVKTAADFETLRQSMDILNGSAEEGERNFERLKRFAAATPFELQELAKAQNTLQGFSLEADVAFNSIKNIGDIAAVTGGDIQAIAVAFGQSAAEGKLFTRDIRQFINQGVPAVALLADALGVAENQVFSLAEAGEISFSDLQNAFRMATEEGGMFADGMKKQSQTIEGLFSSLKDNVSLALGEIGNEIVDTLNIRGLIKRLTDQIEVGVEWFKTLSDESKKMGLAIAGIASLAGPTIALLGGLSIAISAISAPILAVVSTTALAATAIIQNWDKVKLYFTSGGGAQMWNTLKETASSVMDSVKSIISDGTDIIKKVWSEFGEDITKGFEQAFSDVMKIVEFTFGRIEALMGILNNNVKGELNILEDNWLTTLDKINQRVNAFIWDKFVIGGLKAFNILDTEYEKLAKEFEKRGLEAPDFGMIVTKEDLANMRAFLEKVKSVESLDLAKAQEFDRLMAEIASRNVVIEPDIVIPDLKLGSKIRELSVPVNIPVDEIIDNTAELSNLINNTSFNLADKIFPPGSIGALQDRLMQLRDDLLYATTPEEFTRLAEQIGLTEEQIAQLSGTAQKSTIGLTGFLNTLDVMFQQAVLHGEKLGNILANIGKQLASKALINGLAMLLSGGSFSLGKLLFGSVGNIVGVNDALIKSDGSVVKFHPDDNLLAMKDFSNLLGVNAVPQPVINIPNAGPAAGALTKADMQAAFSTALDTQLQRLGPEEIFILSRKGQFGY